MLVRILALASLSLALAVPAALAADGAPPPPVQGTTTAPAAAGARPVGDSGKLAQRLTDLRRRLELAGGAFAKRCATANADAARCTAAAKRLLAALQRIDMRIDTVIARIQQRCSADTTGTTQPSGEPGQTRTPCSHADEVVQVLQNVQAKIRQFEQKLQDWLGNQPAPTANGSSDASTSSTASTDSSLESLDQLTADLAAARDAAAQSGL